MFGMKILLSLLLCLPVLLSAQNSNNKLKFSHISGDLYAYTTHKLFTGSPFPSNSMYLVTNDGVVLFDTPWDETQFQPLLDSIAKRHGRKVILCISTHYHDDRTAGLEFFRKKGIKTMSSKLTYDLCTLHSQARAEHFFVNDTVFNIGGHTFEAHYPGEGHTKDNIVLWFGKEKVLYGGCLIKSTENSSLGNIADASLEQWDETIEGLMKKFPEPAVVVPGHFAWSQGRKSLKHTLKLLRRHKK